MNTDTKIKIGKFVAYTLDPLTPLPIGKLADWWADDIQRREEAKALFLGTPERKPGPGDNSSHFLQEQYEIVPFTGRNEELEHLRNWATKKEPKLSIALLTGGPGSGKSRLARQLSLEAWDSWNGSWFAGALNVEGLPVGASLEPRYFTPLLGALKGPILLSVDHAERQSGLVKALIRAAQDADAQRGKHQTRLLLVARTTGDWLDQLKDKFYDELDNPFEESRRLEIELSPLKVDGDGVKAEFTRAQEAFCEALKGDAKGGTDTPPSQDYISPLLTPGYKPEVLDIHIAALLTTYGTPLPKLDGASDKIPERLLLDALLGREKEAWWEALNGKVPDRTAADRAAIWLGVTGPVKDEDGAFTRLSSLPDLEGKTKAELRAIARALKGLQPDVGEAWLGGLRPDRLATFATEVLQEADLRQAVPALQPEALAQLLTHLAWYWQRYPNQQEKGEARLHATLTAAGANMVPAVLSVAPAVDEPIIVHIVTEQLNAALQGDQAAVFVKACRDCVGSLPENTVVLREFAATITEVTYRNAADPEEKAASANKFSTRLSDLGRHQEALEASREAVGIYRPLAEQNPDAFRSDLAMSLNNLSNRLGDLGRHQEALKASQESIGIRRPLAKKNPDAFQPKLAISLNNLSIRLSDLGQHEKALDAIQEAIGIYRQLAEQNSDAFCPDLAMSLNNLSNRLSDLGQHEKALDAIQEAVGIYWPLAKKNPDAFRPYLAISLNNLSGELSALGRHTEALDAINEAIEIRRPLNVFRPKLAMNLDNLSNILSELGRHQEALKASQEAVGIYRPLAEHNPDTFRPDLAEFLNNLSSRLNALGRHQDALEAINEAIEIRRSLAEQNPDAFCPDLAMSLNTLSNSLSELGRHEEALEAIQEAVGIYRPLAEQNPDAFCPDLAMSLNNLSKWLSDLGQHEEALEAIQEAIEIRRPLAEQNPDAFRPDLATSLTNLSNRLSDLGQHEEALEAIQEAIEIRRPLAKKNPDAFQPKLANSLNNLSNSLSELGRREEALKAIQAAIGIYRPLAEQNPDAFQPKLATSLNNLSNRLSDLGQHEEALEAIQEAVGIYRPLAEQNPDAFQPKLATSLNNLSNRLSELGRHQEAHAASQEAAGIYRPLTKKNPDDFRPDD